MEIWMNTDKGSLIKAYCEEEVYTPNCAAFDYNGMEFSIQDIANDISNSSSETSLSVQLFKRILYDFCKRIINCSVTYFVDQKECNRPEAVATYTLLTLQKMLGISDDVFLRLSDHISRGMRKY